MQGNLKRGGLQAHSYNQIMLSNSSRNIEHIITNLIIDERYKKALEIGDKKYQIRQFKINSLSPKEVFCMYYSLSTRFYYNKTEPTQQSWYENELRVFIWLLIGYSYLQERCVSNLTQKDWQFFSQTFNKRNPEVFQFQALSILRKEVKFVKWSAPEIKLLSDIIKRKKVKNKWNEIAKQLFLQSGKKYFRTAKQCREYWINHLDPTPLRSVWKPSEDYQLVKGVQMVGKRWAKVSKILYGRRTQHMVKNRFKSLEQAQTKLLKQNSCKHFSENEILDALVKRLKAAATIEIQTAISDTPKEAQISKNIYVRKFHSAEENSHEAQVKKCDLLHQQNPLLLEDENNEDDQLLKFTLKTQTVHTFRNIFEDNCKIAEEKQQQAQQSFNNFFESY